MEAFGNPCRHEPLDTHLLIRTTHDGGVGAIKKVSLH
jgi:hypothetical protein